MSDSGPYDPRVSSPWEPGRESWSSGSGYGSGGYGPGYGPGYGSGYGPGSPGPYGGPAPAGPPYGPGGYGHLPPPGPPTSGLAIASLVCGILGFFTLGVASIGAIICGHLAWRETSSGQQSGHGMAIAGLILGYLPVIGWIIFWLSFLLTVATA